MLDRPGRQLAEAGETIDADTARHCMACDVDRLFFSRLRRVEDPITRTSLSIDLVHQTVGNKIAAIVPLRCRLLKT